MRALQIFLLISGLFVRPALADTVCATLVNDIVVGQVPCGETDSTPSTALDTTDARWLAFIAPTYQVQYNTAIMSGIVVTGNVAVADTYGLDLGTQARLQGVYVPLQQGLGFPGTVVTGSISGTTLTLSTPPPSDLVTGSLLSDGTDAVDPNTHITGKLTSTTYSLSGGSQTIPSELLSISPPVQLWPNHDGTAAHLFTTSQFKTLALATRACLNSYTLISFQLSGNIFPPQCTVNIP